MNGISSNIYDYFSSLYGTDYADKYRSFIQNESAQYIRVNSLKTTTEELSTVLKNNYGIETEKINGIKNCLKVTANSHLTGKTIEHIIGLYYIQGLSSMLPPLVLNPSEEENVLDLCSAPGSKTTGMGEMMNNKGRITANEIQLNRVKMLAYNVDRMNLVNTAIMHTKGEWLSKIFPDSFDKILVDAPCSGLGIIQKKGEVSNWWSLERAKSLGELQLKLLVAAVKMAKVGGEIVYSTCTLSVEENELVLNKILEKYPIELLEFELPINSNNALQHYNGTDFNPQMNKAKRILPWESDSDGFFIAKLKKIGETDPPSPAQIRTRELEVINYKSRKIFPYLQQTSELFGIPINVFENYSFLLKGNDIHFFNREWENENIGLFEKIGSKFGVIDKRNELTLSTQAAQILQKHISKNIYKLEGQEEVKTYLEGGIIKKEPLFENQVAVKYEGQIIGMAAAGLNGIKSRFPRAKRTQDIYFDF